MKFALTATLDEVKKYLRANFSKGTDCPACGQFVKLYKRKITSTMALALVILYKEHEATNDLDEYIHFSDLIHSKGYPHQVSNTGDIAKLKYWYLIEPMIGEREDGSNRVGKYRITDLGRDFVEGNKQVPQHVGLYNQQPIPLHDTKMVYIHDVWGDKFNYDELMNA